MPSTIRSILVATDRSESCDPVLRAAAALSALCSADLHVLHAFDLDLLPYDERIPTRPTFAARIQAAEEALDGQIRRSVPLGAQVTSRSVVIHLAHKAILWHAEQVSADLIVLGAHRPRPVADVFLGATADHVIRSANAPCLVVRGNLNLPLRRIVVPIDLSEPARGAVAQACRWAKAFGLGNAHVSPTARTELHIVHVLPEALRGSDSELDHARVREALAGEVESSAGGEGSLLVRTEIIWGEHVADEILRYTREVRADLAVMATHGYGAIRRALIGSVASSVARGAAGPLLLVPPARWNAGEGRDGGE